MVIDETQVCEEISFNYLNNSNIKLLEKLQTIKDNDLLVFLNLYREDYNFDVQKKIYLIELIKEQLKKNKKITIKIANKSTLLLIKLFFKNNKNLILQQNFNRRLYRNKIIKDYLYIFFFIFKKLILSFIKKNKFKNNKNINKIITNSNFDLRNDLKYNYLNEISNKLCVTEELNIINCPNIINFNIFNLSKLFQINNVLLKEHYYSFTEIINIFFKLKKIKSSEKKILDYYDELIITLYMVLKYDKSHFLFFDSFLNFYSFKKIIKFNHNIKYFITWWENQITTKMIFKSIYTYNKDIKKIAFLGYPTRNIDFRILYSQCDLSNNLLPDTIFFIGEYYKKKYFDFSIKCNLNLITSDRYSYLKNYKIVFRKYILVSLPIFEDESNKIINILLNLKKKNSHLLTNFIISIHPSLNTKTLNKNLSILKKSTKFTGKNCFKDFLKFSKLVIGSSSGTIVETLVCGIPVALVNNNISNNSYGVPDVINKNLISSFSNTEQLLEIINNDNIFNKFTLDTISLKKYIFNL